MRAIAVVAAIALSGCTLIDQNTFNPGAGAAPVIPPAPKPIVVAPVPGPPPLLVIGTTDPAIYAEPLRKAVAAARARKPGVVFDVVQIQALDAPGDAGMGGQAAAMGGQAAAMAKVIVGQGIPADRVRLVVRPEAGAKGQEVRIYVR